jgi:hypothetical protein
MEHAIQAPNFPHGHSREGQKRPLIEVAELLIRMRDIGFIRSLTVERVDPKTGRTVPVRSASEKAE